MKHLDFFIEKYIDGEPLNNDTVKWAIRKYIYMNYEPTRQDKLEQYEKLLNKIAEADSAEAVAKLVTNIKNWNYVRTNQQADMHEQTAMENETFYNLLKIV